MLVIFAKRCRGINVCVVFPVNCVCKPFDESDESDKRCVTRILLFYDCSLPALRHNYAFHFHMSASCLFPIKVAMHQHLAYYYKTDQSIQSRHLHKECDLHRLTLAEAMYFCSSHDRDSVISADEKYMKKLEASKP